MSSLSHQLYPIHHVSGSFKLAAQALRPIFNDELGSCLTTAVTGDVDLTRSAKPAIVLAWRTYRRRPPFTTCITCISGKL